jgi:hypothetical protein
VITRPELVEAFEIEQIRRTPPDFEKSLRIVEGLYELARLLGRFPPADPLAGIDVDIRVAEALNVRPPP